MVAALVPIYFGRVGSFVIENRQRDDRRRRGAGGAPGPRSSSCSSRTSSIAGRRWTRRRPRAVPERRAARGRSDERRAAPVPHPHPGRQPADRGGADPDRRRRCWTSARASSPRWASWRCPRACRCPRARRAPARPGACSSGCWTTPRRGPSIHPLVRIGRHAAAGIVEAAAEQEADLMIFGWGGKSGAHREPGASVISPTIDEVVRESPCDIAVVKQRGARDIRRILVPVRGGPHAELALRFADALAHRHDATVVVMHLVPAGVTEAVRAQAERALAVVRRASSSPPAPSRSCARRPTSAPRSCARPSARTSWSWAHPHRPARPAASLFGALPEAIAQRAKPTVIVVKTREPIGRQTFEQLAQKAETLVAADRAAEESRAVPALVDRWFAEANFHHSEFGDLAPAGRAQGEAGRHGQPRAAHAQRGGDDRADRAARDPRDAGALPAPRRDPGHRLRLHGRRPARSPRPRAPASSSTPTSSPATARSAARARRSGSRSTRPRATSWSGRTPTSATGTTGWSTGRSARCSWSRGCST